MRGLLNLFTRTFSSSVSLWVFIRFLLGFISRLPKLFRTKGFDVFFLACDFVLRFHVYKSNSSRAPAEPPQEHF